MKAQELQRRHRRMLKRMLAALKRDFGDFAEFSNTPGTA